MSNETRQAVNELANSVLPASITPQSLGNVLTQIVDEVERKADNTDANVLTSIAYDDLVYDNPFFAMIPTGNANVELFISGYSLTGCTLSWDRTTNHITFTITGPLTIKADGELDIIVGIENPAQKGTYLYSRNTVCCTKNTNNEYDTPWIYKVDTKLLSCAVEYVDQKLGSGGTATVPDAVEDNVVTFATEGQLKDSGKKIGGEEFGEYEQIPIREVVGRGQYGSEAGKVYGYCVAKNDTYINDEIVYKEKECVTAIGKIHYSAPYALLLFNTEGDVNSGFVSSVSYDVEAGNNIVHYLNGERIINANTIATEKGVENFLTTFNLVTPKFKTGDVVYSTNVPKFHFGVMSWEDYVKNPTNDMSTKMPIGLVVDPVKRTFLFCELFNKYFCNSDNIETYFGGYTSFDDGAEAFERISKLKGTSKAVDIPAFYGLRNQGMAGTIFYVKNEVSYVPALEEWRMAKEHLCTAFYGDDDSYAGFMDRLIALKNSIAPSDSLFIGKHNSGVSKLFYSQLSTVGKTLFGNVTFANGAYNMNGEIPTWDNATDEYPCCPVFGIYTEAEENA